MYDLPTSVTVNGESFKIREDGDFRMILHCFKIINTEELDDKEKMIACLMVFYTDFDTVDKVLSLENPELFIEQMFNFIRAEQEESKKNSPTLIDWEKDSLLLTSAINNVASKEIREEKYIHWWTFISYYMAIGDCALSQIVAIRYKIAHGEKLEKGEKKFKEENSQYFNIDYRTAEQKQADDYIQNLWKKGENNG